MCQKWKKEYDFQLREGNLERAIEIKNDNIDRPFYKYRHFDKERKWIDWRLRVNST